MAGSCARLTDKEESTLESHKVTVRTHAGSHGGGEGGDAQLERRRVLREHNRSRHSEKLARIARLAHVGEAQAG
jgi:hypothetical protein